MEFRFLKATGILIAECVGAGILGGLCGYFLKAGITYLTTPPEIDIPESAYYDFEDMIELRNQYYDV